MERLEVEVLGCRVIAGADAAAFRDSDCRLCTGVAAEGDHVGVKERLESDFDFDLVLTFGRERENFMVLASRLAYGVPFDAAQWGQRGCSASCLVILWCSGGYRMDNVFYGFPQHMPNNRREGPDRMFKTLVIVTVKLVEGQATLIASESWSWFPASSFVSSSSPLISAIRAPPSEILPRSFRGSGKQSSNYSVFTQQPRGTC